MTNTATFALGLLSNKGVTAGTIADENTAPGGILFNNLSLNTPVDLIQGASKQLLPGESVAFWLRRTPQNLGTSGTVTGEFVFQLRYRT